MYRIERQHEGPTRGHWRPLRRAWCSSDAGRGHSWLRDVAECDPSHPRAPFYREAAADLEERRGRPAETAAELAVRLGFRPHTP